jgi:hypothetical protein
MCGPTSRVAGTPGGFLVPGTEDVQTPALVIDQAAMDANIAHMHRLIGHRWRPHVKTAKLGGRCDGWSTPVSRSANVPPRLSSPLPRTLAFDDVLLAFAVRGPAVRRVIGLAQKGKRRISVLV